jgi:hypothetical protein
VERLTSAAVERVFGRFTADLRHGMRGRSLRMLWALPRPFAAALAQVLHRLA